MKLTRKDWLAARRNGIGGSDAAAAVGLSPWVTRLELYYDKIGEAPEREENDDMRRGTILEPAVRQMYADATGYQVVVPENIVHSQRWPFALVNLDGLAPEAGRILECKTARDRRGWGEPGSDEIPMVYMIQVQHAMAVLGDYDRADVAVLFGSDFEFAIYPIEADLDFQELLMDNEARFWECVESRTPPEPAFTANDLKLRWPKSRAISVPCSMAEVEAAAILAQVKDRIGRLETIETRAECILKAAMKDGEALSYGGETIATWKSAKASMKFDAKRFQADHPELFSQYLTEAAGSRRFLLKEKCSCLNLTTTMLPAIPENLLLPVEEVEATEPD